MKTEMMKQNNILSRILIIAFLLSTISCIQYDFFIKYGTYTDNRDGITYKTGKIGSNTWMLENLAYKPDSEDGYWAYDNDPNYINVYGYLYDWETACKVCPPDWHLSSESDWKDLEMTLGMSESDYYKIWTRGSQGGKLKEPGTTHWNSPNIDAYVEYGFNALPAGIRRNEYFDLLGTHAFFWTSTSNKRDQWSRSLSFINYLIGRNPEEHSASGLSVRCVKDK